MTTLPSVHDLVKAENGRASDSVHCAKLTQDEARHSRQLYFALVFLVIGRALDKVQGSCEGEGAAARRVVHEQWEPRSRSRFTGLVLSILTFRFSADAQTAIESFERCVRDFEGQSTHVVPAIVINGIAAQIIRLQLFFQKKNVILKYLGSRVCAKT